MLNFDLEPSSGMEEPLMDASYQGASEVPFQHFQKEVLGSEKDNHPQYILGGSCFSKT